MSTQNGNVVSSDDYERIRQRFEGTSFGEHVASVMEAAVEDVKSVTEPAVEAVASTVRSAGRDVAMLLLGFVLGSGTVVLARLIP